MTNAHVKTQLVTLMREINACKRSGRGIKLTMIDGRMLDLHMNDLNETHVYGWDRSGAYSYHPISQIKSIDC